MGWGCLLFSFCSICSFYVNVFHNINRKQTSRSNEGPGDFKNKDVIKDAQ